MAARSAPALCRARRSFFADVLQVSTRGIHPAVPVLVIRCSALRGFSFGRGVPRVADSLRTETSAMRCPPGLGSIPPRTPPTPRPRCRPARLRPAPPPPARGGPAPRPAPPAGAAAAPAGPAHRGARIGGAGQLRRLSSPRCRPARRWRRGPRDAGAAPGSAMSRG